MLASGSIVFLGYNLNTFLERRHAPASMINHRYLYLTIFISGMTGLAVEFAASRLLGNVFGTSNLVWASIIGLILIYLTLGYYLGGRWADRSPYPATLFRILAWAGFLVGVIPVVSKPVLRLSAAAFDQLQIAVLGGSFVAVLILFSVPVTLLGTASPFAIRLTIQDPAQAGKLSGRLYAVSTLGSFAGTFLAVLLLIPTIGTFYTFIIFQRAYAPGFSSRTLDLCRMERCASISVDASRSRHSRSLGSTWAV